MFMLKLFEEFLCVLLSLCHPPNAVPVHCDFVTCMLCAMPVCPCMLYLY